MKQIQDQEVKLSSSNINFATSGLNNLIDILQRALRMAFGPCIV